MQMNKPPSPIDTLARHGIQAPGDYYVDCPYCHHGNNRCGIRVDWGKDKPHTPENLQGTFHCWHCDGSGAVRGAKLYPPKGVEWNGAMSTTPETVVRPEDAPLEYVRCYHEVWKIYRSLYPNSPGQKYLESRGLPGGDIPAGWAPPNRALLLESGLARDVLEELHLIDKRGYDIMGTGGGKVVLPFSWKGKIVTLYGRSVAPDPLMKHYYTRARVVDREGSEVVKWRRGAFADRYLDGEALILTEAPLDALALTCLGAKNVCALGGVANRYAVERIRKDAIVGVALDNDDQKTEEITLPNGEVRRSTNSPGNDAADKLIKALGGERSFRLVPPRLPNGEKVKDWSAYAQGLMELKLPLELPEEMREYIEAASKGKLLAPLEAVGIFH